MKGLARSLSKMDCTSAPWVEMQSIIDARKGVSVCVSRDLSCNSLWQQAVMEYYLSRVDVMNSRRLAQQGRNAVGIGRLERVFLDR